MFCKNCGKQLNAGSSFCAFCGTRVPGNVKNNPVPGNGPAAPAGQTAPARAVTPARPAVTAGAAMATGTAATMSTAKKLRYVLIPILAVVLTIALFVGGFAIYAHYFVKGPEETVERFVDSYNNLDFDEMAECFNPKIQLAYKGISGVGNLVMGALGFEDVNLKELIELIPFLGSLVGENFEMEKMQIEITDVSYSGGKYESFPFKISGVDKMLASDATVTMLVYMNGECKGTRTAHLKRYRLRGWLLEVDFSF